MQQIASKLPFVLLVSCTLFIVGCTSSRSTTTITNPHQPTDMSTLASVIQLQLDKHGYDPDPIEVMQQQEIAISMDALPTGQSIFILGGTTNLNSSGYLIIDTSQTGNTTYKCAGSCGTNQFTGSIIVK